MHQIYGGFVTDQYCSSTTSVGLPREHHQCGAPSHSPNKGGVNIGWV